MERFKNAKKRNLLKDINAGHGSDKVFVAAAAAGSSKINQEPVFVKTEPVFVKTGGDKEQSHVDFNVGIDLEDGVVSLEATDNIIFSPVQTSAISDVTTQSEQNSLLIGLLKKRFAIFQRTLPLTLVKSPNNDILDETPNIEKLVTVCAALVNLTTGIVYNEFT